jgi:hypothetical protein
MSPDEGKTPDGAESEEEERRRRIADQDRRVAEFQHEQLRRLVRLLPIFAGILGILGALTAGFDLFRATRSAKDSETQARVAIERKLEEAKQASAHEKEIVQFEMQDLERTNADLKAQLKKLQGNGGNRQNFAELSPSDRDLINRVKTDEEQLQVRLGKLEEEGCSPI